LLVGTNAQGKSNLLESIAMLATGKSFRTARESELIRFGQALGSVVGAARVAAGKLNLACTIAASAGGTRKTYTLNGESVRYARFLGSVKVVAFVPSDLGLVSGAPSQRRAMLNEALSQADRRYYHALARYRKAILQKNALLRAAGPGADSELLAIYDGVMADSGTEIVLARRHYLVALGEAAASVYGHWIPSERFALRYVPDVSVDTPTSDGVRNAFETRLREQRPAELSRRRSLVGPHRDEIELLLDGEALARFGSQGQQRTAVLALKLGEYAVLRDIAGEAPVLLLDDVLSELDTQRSAAFLAGLEGLEQVFVSATHLPERTASGATTWRIEAASVVQC
jgi:DNA replication and repair protein RecF